MNKKHGKGIYTWSTNNQFKGDFIDDKMCGFGEMVYFGGHRYVGHWVNNKKNGHGVFYYSKGHKYDGIWVDDVRHGKGRLTFYYDSAAEENYDGDWYVNIDIGHFSSFFFVFFDVQLFEMCTIGLMIKNMVLENTHFVQMKALSTKENGTMG